MTGRTPLWIAVLAILAMHVCNQVQSACFVACHNHPCVVWKALPEFWICDYYEPTQCFDDHWTNIGVVMATCEATEFMTGVWGGDCMISCGVAFDKQQALCFPEGDPIMVARRLCPGTQGT